ncbi:hypothetical protein MPSEU_000816200 [Mayamaea pseudoterrestris]|nr:hypothetical protein MPSEU_000816200 [Mayamaea pseudoterrestris]
MGNRNSTELGETPVSGVSLSQDLQDDIVRDFQNKAVQEQWNIFRAGVLGRRHDRHEQLLQAAQQIESHRSASASQAAERLHHLDHAIERMNAAFSDQLVAANHDADHAIKQYSDSLVTAASNASDENDSTSAATNTSPCLGPRAHWMVCAQKYVHDTRPCDEYLAVLDKCVQDAILGKQRQQMH